MKKLFTIFLSLITAFNLSAMSLATEKEFNLIEYLETHEVSTHAELIDVNVKLTLSVNAYGQGTAMHKGTVTWV